MLFQLFENGSGSFKVDKNIQTTIFFILRDLISYTEIKNNVLNTVPDFFEKFMRTTLTIIAHYENLYQQNASKTASKTASEGLSDPASKPTSETSTIRQITFKKPIALKRNPLQYRVVFLKCRILGWNRFIWGHFWVKNRDFKSFLGQNMFFRSS